MFEQFQRIAIAHLPELIITTVWAPLIVGALTIMPYILIILVSLVKANVPPFLERLALIGLLIFVVYLFTPNYHKVADFSNNFPEHEDASHFSNALNSRDLRRLTELNIKWSNYRTGSEILELWKLVRLLPNDHIVRDHFYRAVKNGVISHQEYEEIVSAILRINLGSCVLPKQTSQTENCMFVYEKTQFRH